MASAPLKLYLTAQECEIRNNLTCPIQSCSQRFTSESNLNFHLSKTHNSGNLKEGPVEKWYFCPHVNCTWGGPKHFTKLKLLRQHYMKVHMKKLHECASCKKSFSTLVQLSRHLTYCNVDFTCLSCNASYPCYDTLKTHCRRKNHKLLSKEEYKPINNRLLLLPTRDSVGPPKMVSQETQTDPIPLQKQDNSEDDNNYKSMKTQTDAVECRETSCNTSFNFEDFEFTFKEHIEKNTLGTQTHQHIFSPNLDTLSNLDSNFFTDTKTQTDLMFDNEMFASDYYSDMYTQTCDEILNDFTNIQTQTVFHDTLRSVESQTLMSSVDRFCPSIFKDIVHTETQTDAEFRQMLEIINS
ncbi:PR domain zinc finger protein 1 [Euwallacea fornicatus]|uniref:PR domain zinc finger protein 1 n=1 Tax=Euwallacea fornicatus TaxID=995702 RepID=UPI00339051DE